MGSYSGGLIISEGYLRLRFGGLIFGVAYYFFFWGGGLIIGILRYLTLQVQRQCYSGFIIQGEKILQM